MPDPADRTRIFAENIVATEHGEQFKPYYTCAELAPMAQAYLAAEELQARADAYEQALREIADRPCDPVADGWNIRCAACFANAVLVGEPKEKQE